MQRKARVRTTLAGIALLVLAFPRSAVADSGAFDDPKDSSGALDIARISHENDDDSATYRVEFHEPFTLDDVDGLAWEFDFNSDDRPAEACALMGKIGTTGILRASFYRDCGPEAWATADARLGERAIEFTLPLIDLVEGGGLRPGEPYGYRVIARDRSGIEDTAPEQTLVPHEDVPAPTARPGSAETELGYPGERAGSGAGNAARPAGAEDSLVPGAGEGPAAGNDDGLLGVSFRFGPIPVCSGISCFALGVGAPIGVYALFRFAVRARTRRREPAGQQAPAPDDATSGDEAPRSHPGHSSFV